MATTTIKPNGDVSAGSWSSTEASLYQAIDEGIGSVDDATTRIYCTSATSCMLELEDVPSNFGFATLVTVSVRLTHTTDKDDPLELYIRIYEADGTTPITSELHISPAVGYSTVTDNFYIVGENNADSWKDARIRLLTLGSDGELSVSAVDVNLTHTFKQYSQLAPTATPGRKYDFTLKVGSDVEEPTSNTLSLSHSVTGNRDHSESVSDTLSLSQSVTGTTGVEASASNTLSLSQSVTGNRDHSESVSDDLALTQDSSGNRDHPDSASHTLFISHSVTATTGTEEIVSHTLTLSHSVTGNRDHSESAEHTLTLTHQLGNSKDIPNSVEHTLTLTHDVQTSVDHSHALEHTITLTQDVSGTAGIEESLSHSLALSHSVTTVMDYLQSLSHTLNLTQEVSGSIDLLMTTASKVWKDMTEPENRWAVKRVEDTNESNKWAPTKKTNPKNSWKVD